jgi:hypothetical protein
LCVALPHVITCALEGALDPSVESDPATLAPAGSTGGGPGGNEWTEALRGKASLGGQRVAAALEQIRKSMPGADATMSKALTVADPAYLQAAFTEVEEGYGSLEGYLRRGLRLDRPTIERIRANFLQ